MARLRRVVRSGAVVLALLFGGAAGFVGARWGTGNLGTVVDGQVYRSGQLSPEELARVIRRRGIRTVVNLRGCNPDQAWYRRERPATLAAGAAQVDLSLASDQWLSRDQARAVLEVLDTAERPILIHCEWGSERTGLVAALAALLRPSSTLADARAQFSAYYLFVPARHGLVMRGHLDAYRAWLEAHGLRHSPEQLRRWLAGDYRPGWPSREWWPYNPYPLVVVTRPASAGGRVAGAGGIKAVR